jgi:hypothetical protein
MKPSFQRHLPHVRPWQWALLIAASSCGALFLVAPRGLTGWDPIQFALGLQNFDMAHHQPHPPGYLGHMAFAWMLARGGLDTGEAVRWASLLAGSGAVFATFFLGRRLYGDQAGVAAALLTATHPLASWAALSGETYSIEALGAVVLVLAGLRVSRGSGFASLVTFFALYGLLGGVRQSLPVYFFPFALWRLIECCRGIPFSGWAGRFLIACGTAIAGILAWAVPLSVLAGGPAVLMDAFTNQFFSVFGKAYSPLMGAGHAAVMSNLDGLWRFAVGALSVSGILAIILRPITKPPASGASTRAAVLACWILPPLTWFVLMYVYKAGHLLVWVPAISVVAGGVFMSLPGSARRLGPMLAAAASVAQIALFLAPPVSWTTITGARGLASIEYAGTLAKDTTSAIDDIAGGNPASVLVVTRDAQFTFREAMFRLPATHVLWLVDGDSTGAPLSGVEVCEGFGHRTGCRSGHPFWDWDNLPPGLTIHLDRDVRHIAWFAAPSGPFVRALTSGTAFRRIQRPPVTDFLVTDVGDGPVDIRIGPYVFSR